MANAPNMNTHFLVVNVDGTTGLRCGCRSWIRHWQKYSFGTRQVCTVLGCTNVAEVGAHVRSVDYRRDQDMWIAPLCKTCNSNHNIAPYYLDSRSKVVRAEKMEKCGPG